MDNAWVLQNAWLIPLMPLLAYVFIVFFGRRFGERASWIGVLAVGVSTVLSTLVFLQVLGGASVARTFDWVTFGEFDLTMGFRIGNMESVLLFSISMVAWFIQIYAQGYMHGDARYNRFFAIVNLFTFGMLTLLMSDNFLLFLIAWEIMGLCSYLLIGHWFEELKNARAAMKAFMTTRVGDVGLMLGIWVLFTKAHSFNFDAIFHAVEAGEIAGATLTAAALLLFMGSVGKSAQFPLHVWLPDAMAGPTPVSALIHAATMVAAGVFLVARSYPIFHATETALMVVAYIGAFTALFAATIATVNDDIKGVLAYSTISQLGYMIMALGVGAFTAGVFHLMTHAFFKAMLFLGSGSVIHAVHTQNMHEMGGLWNKMKVTGATFIIGALALAGIPPFAGFYSKDEILLGAFTSHYPATFWMGLAAAVLTAFYMTRQVILVFFGRPRDRHAYEHAHESPPVMTVPLILLAIPSAVFGYLATRNHWISDFVHFAAAHGEGHAELVPILAIGGAVLGIVLGFLIYGTGTISRAAIVNGLRPIHTLLKNKYYVDEAYQFVFVKGGVALATVARLFDTYVIDGIVNLVGYLGLLASRLSAAFDLGFIDEAINGVADLTVAGGRAARNMVSGYVQLYVMTLFAAVVLGLIVYVIL